MNKLLSLVLLIGVALAPSALRAQGTSEPFRLSKVSYVMLGVSNIPASLNFYEGKLGLKTTSKSDDLAFIDAGSISLVISSEVSRQPGDSEIVFAVEHVQPAYEAVTHAGVKFDHEPHPVTDSSWAANFRDPDGHILSLFGQK